MKLFLGLLLTTFTLLALDINHADTKELTTLKGVGAKTAQKIVDYRTKYGCFTSIEDLVKVKGVGKKTLEKNKTILEVKECKTK